MSVATLVPMAWKTKKTQDEDRCAEMDAAVELVRQAKAQGLELTRPGGLLKQFAKAVIEIALEEEMTEHLGRTKHEKTKGGVASNSRNGKTSKTVLTDTVGPVGPSAAGNRAA